ncbi:hypothetical protein BOTBODRAFT_27750 [Botryobasidium botryosum FD-172 SS1]|uniref:Coatomer subunit epsilon n=1 Tax=Botryobasidium botryosum (strain FD-172 SS1) TaxID=930990 RepID=A0A067N9B0_BOTB1|nr:hypothetical protein BOTBODRAFT_27750 [Botryobasidium botryosum FD-172 SS1]
MDSDSLFHLKSQFYLGAYQSVVANPAPSTDSPEYLPTILYIARSYIALSDPAKALSLLPSASTEPAIRAVRALATYVQDKAAEMETESVLEELRDLCLEIDGEVGVECVDVVKVAAATAFIQEEELEEALTTLGAGTGAKEPECAALTVQIYLSINRPDLAKKEYEAAKRHADDSLLIQLIEAAIGAVAGGPQLRTAYHIYAEQAAAPGSSTNAAINAAKGVAQLLRGNVAEAQGDFSEALRVDPRNAEALVGAGVAADLSGRRGEGDKYITTLREAHPTHPLVIDLDEKVDAFDEAASKFSKTVSVAA